MTTLVLKLPPVMARRLAKTTDILSMESNEAAALEGVRLFLDSILGPVRGRRPQQRGLRRRPKR